MAIQSKTLENLITYAVFIRGDQDASEHEHYKFKVLIYLAMTLKHSFNIGHFQTEKGLVILCIGGTHMIY